MNNEWNLDKLYSGLDDPKYLRDGEIYEEIGKEYAAFVEKIKDVPTVQDVEHLLESEERMMELLQKMYLFVSLKQSVDTENGALLAELNNLMRMSSEFVGADAKAVKVFAKIPSLDEYAEKSELIRDYRFFLSNKIDSAKHLLSDAEEELYAQMDMTGGAAWGNLQSYLTSTVTTDYEGKKITLTEARNLAYDPDATVRKKAYEAELACYDRIADSVAYAMNNIKLQMNMIARKRGFKSPLDETLNQSHMSRKTLDAMIAAMEEHMPKIRKYYLHKSQLLGHEGPLPWYDLFAPLGKSDKKYTVEDAKEILTSTFEKFTPEMSALMKEAFENEWIDFFPRAGKQGGAYDAGAPTIKESRVMTNFDGSFSSIDTLAHELGHSFHDRQVQDNRPLNMDYPMQVAETASTFNETHLCNYFVKNARNKEEKLALLEGLLTEQTQCIVDIYSRYLLETSVFEQCEETFLMKEDLNKLMLEAQKKAYGEGVDEATLNPYMWCCKSHYYSTGLSFYNFPYAFGVLFAAGLYDMFVKEGAESFVPKYKAMLKATPTVTVEEAGKLMGIDLTDKKFWEASLEMIESSIEEYCSL